jgi:hypothetical protein
MLKHANSALYIGAIVSFRWIPVSVFSEYRPAASGRNLPTTATGQYQTVRDGWEEWRSLDIGESSRIESLL